MKPSDRYLKIVEWSDEDGCYVGTCPGLMLGGVHGRNEARVYAELCRAVEEWIAVHEQDGTPLPPVLAETKLKSGCFNMASTTSSDTPQYMAIFAKVAESLIFSE